MYWKIWLLGASMWMGWAVYQIVTGPVWWALACDIIATVAYVGIAIFEKKKNDRSKA